MGRFLSLKALIVFGFGSFLIGGCESSFNIPQDVGVEVDAADATPAYCTSDEACSDGLFCTGVERCKPSDANADARGCVQGTPPCAASCNEDKKSCVTDCGKQADADGDGHAAVECGGDDCDDADPLRFPGNNEVCDPLDRDEDCDPTTFGTRDVDGDGFVDAQCCNIGETQILCGDDCDDLRANVSPSNTEACDSFDNDCDGTTDEGVAVSGFVDVDFDGHGDLNRPIETCPGSVLTISVDGAEISAAFSLLGDDCDDTDESKHPAQIELCDNVDNNCNGAIDESSEAVNWYADTDGDGFGDANDVISSCSPIAGRVLRGTDCNDSDAAIHPAASELCDGVDNNCNGLLDFQIAPNDFEDDDGDGILDARCIGGTDCDDGDPVTGAGSQEICDGIDNDCDDSIDENVAEKQWYVDRDQDGFGTVVEPVVISCLEVEGRTDMGGDCADNDPGRRPTAIETCNNLDDDCDGSTDEGADTQCPALPAGTNNATGIGCFAGRCQLECEPGTADADGDIVNGCEQEGGDCPAGMLDCDGDGACETNRFIDPNHCGGCDTACEFVDGFGQCVSGECVLTQCTNRKTRTDPVNNPLQCDGDESLSQCGLSGEPCNLPANVNGDCINGACINFNECGYSEAGQARFGSCDGDDANGCEEILNTDQHCGECGNSCGSLEHVATSSCGRADGRDDWNCLILTCDAGWDDCDRDPRNGCETDLSQPENCGSCGFRCEPNSVHAASNVTCNSGVCQILNCDEESADCDGVVDNGCEVRLQSDSCGCAGGPSCFDNFPGREVRCVAQSAPNMPQCIQFGCSNGQSECDGNCVNLSEDINNCGGCNNMCSSPVGGGARCENGGCIDDCGGGDNVVCDVDGTMTCVNVRSDVNHCGFCGNDCGEAPQGGEVHCRNFNCEVTCPPGQMECDGACIDVQNDVNNCGGCNIQCSAPPNAMALCSFGACRHQCDSGRTDCFGACVDTFSDANNCGACGRTCLGGANVNSATCNVGSCNLDCVGASADCDGDPSNGCETDLVNDCSCDQRCGVAGSCQVGSCADIVKVVYGKNHTCALKSNGRMACWGDNSRGQLGVAGGPGVQELQIPFGAPLPVIDISAGSEHTCAIVENGPGTTQTYCWGRNDWGQVNNVAGSDISVPTLNSNPTSARKIAAGDRHTCSVHSVAFNNEIRCWGANDKNQLGRGGLSSPFSPVQHFVASPQGPLWFTNEIAAGGDFTCVTRGTAVGQESSEVYCWGDNSAQQLGRGLTPPVAGNAYAMPVGVWSMFRPERLSLGDAHACLVAMNNGTGEKQLNCWGDSGANQFTPSIMQHHDPIVVSDHGLNIEDVFASANFTCVRTDGQEIWCRGDALGGNLTGDPNGPLMSFVKAHGVFNKAKNLAVDGFAGSHVCIGSEQGKVHCWGMNPNGQLTGVFSGNTPDPRLVETLTP